MNTESTESTQETSAPTSAPTSVATPNEVVTIPTQNPSQEELASLCQAVTESTEASVVVTGETFNFQTNKKDKMNPTIREALILPIPVPSAEGLLAIIEGGEKPLELLNDAVRAIINSQARKIFSEDISLNAGNFPYEQLSWDFISRIPKAVKGGISKEAWDAFAAD